MKWFFTALLVLAVDFCAVTAYATVNIDLVTVDNAGNAGEWSGSKVSGGYGPSRICGGVSYNYEIGKYEVTAAQYTEFLNVKATVGDTYGLYNTSMWSSTVGCKIQRSGAGTVLDPYVYNVAAEYAYRPVNYVGFWDALRFVNWLSNGQGNGDTETGSYTLNGYYGSDGHTIARNSGATWVLPTEDEWYKAAYHKNDGITGNYWDFPTGTDSVPGRDISESTHPGNNANYYGSTYPIDSPYYTTLTGQFQLSHSPYGTFDQGGNVYEWNETVVGVGVYGDGQGWCQRGIRGGAFAGAIGATGMLASYRGYYYTQEEYYYCGLRIAYVPEPGSIALFATSAILGLLVRVWRHRRP